MYFFIDLKKQAGNYCLGDNPTTFPFTTLKTIKAVDPDLLGDGDGLVNGEETDVEAHGGGATRRRIEDGRCAVA